MRPGDIIVALDGVTIAGADDLVRALTGDKIGRSVAFDVLRGTERLTIAAVPQERRKSRLHKRYFRHPEVRAKASLEGRRPEHLGRALFLPRPGGERVWVRGY